MAPPLIQLKDIKLTFGGTPLLSGVELSVSAGERVCLIGRNGSGKSTLLKIAAGLVESDSGSRFVQPGATVRYLPQEPDFSGFATTLAYVEDGLGPGDDHYQARYVLEQLGLHGDEDPAHISGGEARRTALARVLAPSPDILLLDEPTNHLDLTTIEWLEGELASRRSALVIISHDRRFMSNLSRATAWLDRGQIKQIDKGFSAFETWRDEVLAEEERDQHKLDRKIVMEEHWLRYGVSGRRKRNVKRLGNLFALREQRRDYRGAAGNANLAASEADKSGKLIIEAKGIGRTYGERKIVDDFSIRVQRGDRIGIVGPNGAGKTTLIEMLTGGKPPDSGTIRFGANIEMVDARPAPRKPRPEIDAGRRPHRRRQRQCDGRRQAEARGQLHEGLPVRAGADAHAAGSALRRRARPADAGAGAGKTFQPAGAGRADQRPRSRNPRRARGNARRLRRHRDPDQP